VSRSSYSHLWRLGLLLAGLAATPATWADPLSAVEVLRAGGCGGVMPAAQPLRHNSMLDRTAAEWALGQSLPAASERNGYRGDFTAGLHISGPDSTTLQLLRRSGCRMLAGRETRDIGVYRRGLDSWIVVASIYRSPPGLQASVGTPIAAARASSWDTPATPAPALSTSPAVARPLPSETARAVLPTPALPPALSPTLATRALQLVNDVRARGTHCGDELFGPAPPVTLSGTLANVALGHANDMAEKNYFEHVDPTGQSPADRVRATGYLEKLVGENIAYGPKSVDEVVQGWLDSPGHCENIMDPRFVEMGIALAPGHVKRGLYWVQVLAEPRA
jgi:uncharacterized protein YkwD